MKAEAQPTQCLFGPADGEDYVVSDAVKGLARRVRADTVVLGCVQLAAGTIGRFQFGCVFSRYLALALIICV